MNILFVGLGNLGSQVFDLFFLRATRNDKFLVAGRNLEYLLQRTALTTYAAAQLDTHPEIDCAYLDVRDVEQTAQMIWSFKPDVIFSSVTIQPSSAISKLPKPLFDKLSHAGSGMWLPLTLTLVHKLMLAVKQTELQPIVLNGAAPDNAHAVLGKVGLAPTTGVGNLGNALPALKQLIAAQLQRSIKGVEVFFTGHNQVFHHLRKTGDPGSVPFHLAVQVNGENVTQQLNVPALFKAFPQTMRHEYTQLLSAASAAAVFDAIAKKSTTLVHAPGPNGLPGAYPLRAHEHGVEVVLPPELSLEDAIRINQEGQTFDGIERIDEDGTVFFSVKNMAILKETLGYECWQMPLVEVEGRADELRAKYLEHLA